MCISFIQKKMHEVIKSTDADEDKPIYSQKKTHVPVPFCHKSQTDWFWYEPQSIS